MEVGSERIRSILLRSSVRIPGCAGYRILCPILFGVVKAMTHPDTRGSDTETIRREHFDRWQGKRMIAMIWHDDGFEIYEQTAESTMPPSRYDTLRKAASRILQLLGIGPVAPQTHPEVACLGSISVEDEKP
jgi:hypothetical protein